MHRLREWNCRFLYITPEMSKRAVKKCLNVPSYIMKAYLPFILKFVIFLIFFEDLVSAQCIVEISACLIVPIRCVGLTTLPPSCADCLKIWEPQPPGTLRDCQGL
jgi:hypothetical protein